VRDFARPRVIISRCIEFEKVRWDGQIIRSDFVRRLIPHVDPITVCPEVEIGLGVPRDSIRIVKLREGLRLVQPSTGLDVTEKMQEFVDSFLDSIEEVDGFIMKSGSPTSGLGRIKVYPGLGKVAPIDKTAGFLGAEVKRRFPHLAVEDDGKLRNARIGEHFLRKIFTLAWFREIRGSEKMNELVRFQTENKLLFKAYSQKELREMDRIVANRDRHDHDICGSDPLRPSGRVHKDRFWSLDPKGQEA